MNYVKDLAKMAKAIIEVAEQIGALEKERAEWLRPEYKTFRVGNHNYYVVRKDGTVTPGLEGVQREAIKALDDALIRDKSKLEGLHYQLSKLGKKGGAA